MKKLLCGLLMVLLLIALAGCGGGSSPVGKTMTNDEVNAKYGLGLEGMEAFNQGLDYIVIPTDSMSTAGFKAENSLFNWSGFSNGFKAFVNPNYTWTSTGSGGWYTTQETVAGITFTYWVRYLEASNTIELKESYTKDGETVSEFVSLTQTGNKWSGSASATSTSAVGKMVLDVTFANVDGAAHGSGSYKVWVTVTSDLGSIPKTLFAEYTVKYDPENAPDQERPIKLSGWYGMGDDIMDFRTGIWVPIPN